LDNPTEANRSRFRLRSPGGLLLLGIALFVLLALVAAVSRAHHTPGGHAGIHSPPAGVGNYLFTIFAIVLAAGFLFLVYEWFSERDLLAQAHRSRQRKGTYRALVLIFLFLALVPMLRNRLHLFQNANSTKPAHVNKGPHSKQKTKSAHPAIARPPKFEVLPIALATAGGLLLLGYIGLRTMRRARTHLVARYVLEREFESLLDETLDDLYANQDPRAAIIAAYARMEKLFAARGFARDPAETSMEYLARCVGELRASGAALGRLTGLFQRAKFSTHAIDQPMRDEAIQALTQVRDELRAQRQEDELRRAEAQRMAETRGEPQEAADSDRTFGEDPFKAAAEKMRGSVYSGGRGT